MTYIRHLAEDVKRIARLRTLFYLSIALMVLSLLGAFFVPQEAADTLFIAFCGLLTACVSFFYLSIHLGISLALNYIIPGRLIVKASHLAHLYHPHIGHILKDGREVIAYSRRGWPITYRRKTGR